MPECFSQFALQNKYDKGEMDIKGRITPYSPSFHAFKTLYYTVFFQILYISMIIGRRLHPSQYFTLCQEVIKALKSSL